MPSRDTCASVSRWRYPSATAVSNASSVFSGASSAPPRWAIATGVGPARNGWSLASTRRTTAQHGATLIEYMTQDRLTPLDASFLHLEDASQHMHVAAALLFKGDAPPYEQLLTHVESRLGLVPRYRQRLAYVPLAQAR